MFSRNHNRLNSRPRVLLSLICSSLLFNDSFGYCGDSAGFPPIDGSAVEASYVFPGENSKAHQEILGHVETEFVKLNHDLENVLIRARYGEIRREAQPYDPKNGFAVPPTDGVAPSTWSSLEFVAKNGKRRFQSESKIEFNNILKEVDVYRIFDGNRYVAYDDRHLELYPKKSTPEDDWQSIVPTFYEFQKAFDGKNSSLVPNACRYLHTWITSVEGGEDTFGLMVRSTKFKNGLFTVETKRSGTASERVSVFTVDSKKGYQLVQASDYFVGETRTFKLIVESDVVEIVPEVFFLKTSRRSLFSQEKNSPAPVWVFQTLEVIDVEVGDFVYDDSKFEIASLPVPKGTVVTDHSATPPHQFVYGKAPFNEENLRAAMAPLGRPSGDSSFRWLIAINMVIIIIAFLLWFLVLKSRRTT